MPTTPHPHLRWRHDKIALTAALVAALAANTAPHPARPATPVAPASTAALAVDRTERASRAATRTPLPLTVPTNAAWDWDYGTAAIADDVSAALANAKARQEAEAAAAAQQAAQAAAEAESNRRTAAAVATPAANLDEIRSYARDLVGDEQFACLDPLWQHESGWNPQAHNPSGAHGIPQALPGSKMSSAGPDWQTNPRTQIQWGLSYIAGRYGTPCQAWTFWQQKHWY